MELLKEKLMTEEAKEPTVQKRARPRVEEPVERGNTIIDLGSPKIIITKAEEPAVEVEAPISEETRREMEAGRKIIDGFK